MHKFKVGDKVRHKPHDVDICLRSTFAKRVSDVDGVYTVTYANPSSDYIHIDATQTTVWHASRFELVTEPTFKIGDRVKLVDGHGLSAAVGATAEVTGIFSHYITIKWDRTNPLRNSQLDGNYYPKAFELVTEPAPAPVDNTIRVGDRVEFIDKSGQGSREARKGDTGEITYVGPKSQYDPAELVTVKADRGVTYSVFATRLKKLAPVPAPAPSPLAAKAWIVVLQNADGSYAPAATPRKYGSAEQARSVARSMSEKHLDQTFVVFEAVGVALTPAPVKPQASFTAL